MKVQDLGKSTFLNLLFKPAGMAMESRLRRIFHDPEKLLDGAGVKEGQVVLEVGSGTGFFTIPAAKRIGDQGRLIAIEPLATYAARLTERIEVEGLMNVQVFRRDAVNTKLASDSIDRVLLFGVLPFPSLPLNRLLPEMHRVLTTGGVVAVWQFPVDGWVPGSIGRSAWFDYLGKHQGVHTYRRCDAGS